MKVLLKIINWKRKLGLLVICAIMLGVLAGVFTKSEPISKEIYEAELTIYNSNKAELKAIQSKIEVNEDLLQEFMKSPEYKDGLK